MRDKMQNSLGFMRNVLDDTNFDDIRVAFE